MARFILAFSNIFYSTAMPITVWHNMRLFDCLDGNLKTAFD